jgi:hypothetical protein
VCVISINSLASRNKKKKKKNKNKENSAGHQANACEKTTTQKQTKTKTNRRTCYSSRPILSRAVKKNKKKQTKSSTADVRLSHGGVAVPPVLEEPEHHRVGPQCGAEARALDQDPRALGKGRRNRNLDKGLALVPAQVAVLIYIYIYLKSRWGDSGKSLVGSDVSKNGYVIQRGVGEA